MARLSNRDRSRQVEPPAGPDSQSLTALTIAGSDPSGGAGIQRDLSVFQSLGAQGLSCITAITAQNSSSLSAICPTSPHLVHQQLSAIFEEFQPQCCKTGVLWSSEIAGVVAQVLRHSLSGPLVVDPVLRASVGFSLAAEDLPRALLEKLLPLAAVITPNVPEAEALTGRTIRDLDSAREAARWLSRRTAAVVLKGGHLPDAQAVDIVARKGKLLLLEPKDLFPGHMHGSGCAFSAALTVFLGRGSDLFEAAAKAKDFVAALLGQL